MLEVAYSVAPCVVHRHIPSLMRTSSAVSQLFFDSLETSRYGCGKRVDDTLCSFWCDVSILARIFIDL